MDGGLAYSTTATHSWRGHWWTLVLKNREIVMTLDGTPMLFRTKDDALWFARHAYMMQPAKAVKIRMHDR